ncbi:RNA polymerase subunit sigma, partial [Clostridioides difficile]|nr:RNA polymerase subunit sigma [Blautia producta]
MFCAGFFCTRKNFFTFFQIHATNHTLLYRYGAERGINTFHVITERRCDDMKPSDFQKTIQCQFDCKLKRVVKGIVRNYRKELKRRRNKEISYCELPEIVVE